MKKRYIFFLVLMSFLFPLGLHAENSSEPNLEGIILDRAHPDQSLAVINGEPVKAGMTAGDYRVIEIQNAGVVVENLDSGARKTLEVTAPQVNPASLEPESEESVMPATPPPPTSASPSLLGQIGSFIKQGKNPMLRVWELMGIRDLAQINNAAVHYYDQKKAFPKTFEELTQSGLLPSALKSGVTAHYRYYFASPVFGVHADPVDPNSGMRYFFIGVDAVVRESTGSPAGTASPEHDYPGRKR